MVRSNFECLFNLCTCLELIRSSNTSYTPSDQTPETTSPEMKRNEKYSVDSFCSYYCESTPKSTNKIKRAKKRIPSDMHCKIHKGSGYGYSVYSLSADSYSHQIIADESSDSLDESSERDKESFGLKSTLFRKKKRYSSDSKLLKSNRGQTFKNKSEEYIQRKSGLKSSKSMIDWRNNEYEILSAVEESIQCNFADDFLSNPVISQLESAENSSSICTAKYDLEKNSSCEYAQVRLRKKTISSPVLKHSELCELHSGNKHASPFLELPHTLGNSSKFVDSEGYYSSYSNKSPRQPLSNSSSNRSSGIFLDSSRLNPLNGLESPIMRDEIANSQSSTKYCLNPENLSKALKKLDVDKIDDFSEVNDNKKTNPCVCIDREARNEYDHVISSEKHEATDNFGDDEIKISIAKAKNELHEYIADPIASEREKHALSKVSRRRSLPYTLEYFHKNSLISVNDSIQKPEIVSYEKKDEKLLLNSEKEIDLSEEEICVIESNSALEINDKSDISPLSNHIAVQPKNLLPHFLKKTEIGQDYYDGADNSSFIQDESKNKNEKSSAQLLQINGIEPSLSSNNKPESEEINSLEKIKSECEIHTENIKKQEKSDYKMLEKTKNPDSKFCSNNPVYFKPDTIISSNLNKITYENRIKKDFRNSIVNPSALLSDMKPQNSFLPNIIPGIAKNNGKVNIKAQPLIIDNSLIEYSPPNLETIQLPYCNIKDHQIQVENIKKDLKFNFLESLKNEYKSIIKSLKREFQMNDYKDKKEAIEDDELNYLESLKNNAGFKKNTDYQIEINLNLNKMNALLKEMETEFRKYESIKILGENEFLKKRCEITEIQLQIKDYERDYLLTKLEIEAFRNKNSKLSMLEEQIDNLRRRISEESYNLEVIERTLKNKIRFEMKEFKEKIDKLQKQINQFIYKNNYENTKQSCNKILQILFMILMIFGLLSAGFLIYLLYF